VETWLYRVFERLALHIWTRLVHSLIIRVSWRFGWYPSSVTAIFWTQPKSLRSCDNQRSLTAITEQKMFCFQLIEHPASFLALAYPSSNSSETPTDEPSQAAKDRIQSIHDVLVLKRQFIMSKVVLQWLDLRQGAKMKICWKILCFFSHIIYASSSRPILCRQPAYVQERVDLHVCDELSAWTKHSRLLVYSKH